MSEAPTEFEEYMQLGVHHHMHGDYKDALYVRFTAYESADNSIDSGRAARDIAASFDRLGNIDLGGNEPYATEVSNQTLAEAYAEYAVREHEKFVPKLSVLRDNDSTNIESLMSGDAELSDLTLRGSREFTASSMYAAVLEARRGHGKSALNYSMRAVNVGWALSQRYGRFHQYDVNLMARAAGIEGVFGKKPYSIGTSKTKVALDLARISETEEVLGHNESLTEEEIRQAQQKAIIRAKAARGIVRLAQLPTSSLTQPIARKILNKVVL